MKNQKKQQQDHEYEFLDLSDVDDIERTRLSSALLHKQQQQLQEQQKRHKKHQAQKPEMKKCPYNFECFDERFRSDGEQQENSKITLQNSDNADVHNNQCKTPQDDTTKRYQQASVDAKRYQQPSSMETAKRWHEDTVNRNELTSCYTSKLIVEI